MHFEVNKTTPVRRILFVALLPAMVFSFVKCADVRRPVSVPSLRNVAVSLRHVRVLVGTGSRAEPLEISAKGKVTIWSADGRTVLDTITLDRAKAASSRGRVILGGRDLGSSAVTLAPSEGQYIKVGDQAYPDLIALVTRGEAVMAINYVNMEDYVAGVVSCELPARFDAEAHKAQAVAARTYALWTMTDMRLSPYDLYDNQRSQVYRGVTGTGNYGRRAARDTAGVVLVDEWRFLPAFYFSTCGGHTAPPSNMRGAPPGVAPLEAAECGYCRHSPKYQWRIEIPVAEVEQALIKSGNVRGTLEEIRVTKAAPGGWVEAVDVISSGGTQAMSGYALRQNIGTSRLLSCNFAVTRSGKSFHIEGRGLGHGVGLCQFGADGMGSQGNNYAEILQHYYKGAQIIKIY